MQVNLHIHQLLQAKSAFEDEVLSLNSPSLHQVPTKLEDKITIIPLSEMWPEFLIVNKQRYTAQPKTSNSTEKLTQKMK